MRRIILIVAIVLFSLQAYGLTEKQQKAAALNLAQQWKNKRIKPILSPDGKILYAYGPTAVTIVTKVYHFTDIELQAGETIKNISIGDSIRWATKEAYHGTGANKVLHIFIKPFDRGLKTNMTLLTNKRAYRFNLKSAKGNLSHMGIVGFLYPEDHIKKINADRQKQERYERQNLLTGIDNKKTAISSLDFNYKMSGKASWKPVRVFNDGKKTIIELPAKAQYKKIPILSVLDSNKETEIVNYRFLNNKFVVDKLFDNAILLSGSGRSQKRINIKYTGAK